MNGARHKLLVLDSRVEERVQEIRANRDWWPCRRGCANCCRHLANPPELSPEEWVRVDEAVASLPAEIRTEVEKKIEALLTQIAENNIGKHVVCPYLDELEGSCRIYEARPIACRTYGFFVARDGNQYCEMIEAEVASRNERNIVWGNAEAIRDEIARISGAPVPFKVHYHL